jgi:hypothetical protein
MIAYKWFRRIKGKLTSHNTNLPPALRAVYYEGGNTNLPKLKGSKIFVFKTLDYAYKYLDNIKIKPSEELWQVQIPDNSKSLEVRSDVDPALGVNIYEEFWKLKSQNKTSFWTAEAPKGTVGADELILRKRVRI